MQKTKINLEVEYPTQPFIAGETYINVAPITPGCYGVQEIKNLLEVIQSGHFTEGEWVRKLEKELARYVGVRFASMCNSGSSANLLALSALTSPLLGSRAIQPGDEIITAAVGFPTTVNPIFQVGCVPVFVDSAISTHNPMAYSITNSITQKTKAIMIAHTLGNLWDVETIRDICDENNLWLIEDCCDALGGEWENKKAGSFGNLSTLSFFPAHHMTTGEGGMVFTDDAVLNKIVRSFRDWGRDCWCQPGKDNTCGKRFTQEGKGDLPDCYDHKYIYSHIGYNLKSTDLQAAIGLAQFKKLPEFVQDRQENWKYLFDNLKEVPWLILSSNLEKAKPSWFGFIISVDLHAPFTRNELTQHLETQKIGTRNVFAGNIIRQPAYKNKTWKIADTVSNLANADRIMNQSFWIGVHPQLTKKQLDYMILTIKEFVQRYSN